MKEIKLKKNTHLIKKNKEKDFSLFFFYLSFQNHIVHFNHTGFSY